MLLNSRLLLCSLLAVLGSPFYGQDLSPRAYVITPMHFNAITLTWSFYDGGGNLNGTVPITGATGRYNVPVFSYYRSLNFFGRSANITLSLRYAVGNFSGEVLGNTNPSIARVYLIFPVASPSILWEARPCSRSSLRHGSRRSFSEPV
jgi:hypothetical protein